MEQSWLFMVEQNHNAAFAMTGAEAVMDGIVELSIKKQPLLEFPISKISITSNLVNLITKLLTAYDVALKP